MNYKFDEDLLINELKSYVDKTYNQHYATDKFQATDIIIDSGHGTGFCLGNVIKYAKRYGNKGTPADARKDILKILHYSLIQLHIHDQANKVANKGEPSSVVSNRRSINDAKPEHWDAAAKAALRAQ
tara:strand:+ start:26726 stop:27106 length:381 start_codon:yes stop_codon:yes gene_type:complete